MKSYQLIELAQGSKFDFGTECQETEIVILSWLINNLEKSTKLKTLPVEIKLITAKYEKKYPCIGIHYLNENTRDLEQDILELIDEIQNTSSFKDLYNFIIDNQTLIRKNIVEFQNN